MQNRIKSLIKKLSRFGYQIKARADSHIDPVCGMSASSDMFSAEYHGKVYYFCSDHCKQQFEANPANFSGE